MFKLRFNSVVPALFAIYSLLLLTIHCNNSWGKFWAVSNTPVELNKKVISVFVVGTQRLSGTNSNWWIKKYDENGIEDTVNWNKTFGGGANFDDSPNAIALDSLGNVYVVGYQSVGASNRNWWIKKFSFDGIEDTINWNKSFEGGATQSEEAFAVAIDGQDNVFIAGSKHNGSDPDWWLKKYSSNGIEDTVNWNKTIFVAAATDTAQALKIAADGSVYIAGTMVPSTNFGDFEIKKFNTAGTEIVAGWPVELHINQNDGVNALALDAAGNVYAGGYSGAASSKNTALRKYSATAVIDSAWTKDIDGGAVLNTEEIRALVLDSAGNLYAGGSLEPASSNPTWMLKKYDSTGTEIITGWNKSFDAQGTALDVIYGLAVDSKNNVYAAGLCTRATTLNDWCIKKYNSSGAEDTINWNKIFDGGFNLNENATAITVVER